MMERASVRGRGCFSMPSDLKFESLYSELASGDGKHSAAPLAHVENASQSRSGHLAILVDPVIALRRGGMPMTRAGSLSEECLRRESDSVSVRRFMCAAIGGPHHASTSVHQLSSTCGQPPLSTFDNLLHVDSEAPSALAGLIAATVSHS